MTNAMGPIFCHCILISVSSFPYFRSRFISAYLIILQDLDTGVSIQDMFYIVVVFCILLKKYLGSLI